MKKNIARILGVGLILTLFSLPVTMAASADDDDQPHMQAALEALKQAEQHLNMAKHDKGGHRAAALKATQEAIKHTEMGMKAGAKNEEKHEHDHDHDKK